MMTASAASSDPTASPLLANDALTHCRSKSISALSTLPCASATTHVANMTDATAKSLFLMHTSLQRFRLLGQACSFAAHIKCRTARHPTVCWIEHATSADGPATRVAPRSLFRAPATDAPPDGRS